MLLSIALCLAVVSGKPSEVVLDRGHDGLTVHVVSGEKVTVRLHCRPGTGYSWHETVSGEGVLAELEESRFEPLPEDVGKEDKEGGPALHVFRYVAKKPGTAKFVAYHMRPHRTGSEILGSFVVTVEVADYPPGDPAEKPKSPHRRGKPR